jgi:hypothetical protein
MEWNGVQIVAEVEGRMDSEQYVTILQDCLLPSMEYSGVPPEDIIFQQGNDPKYMSKLATNGLRVRGLLLWSHQLSLLTSIQ